MSIAELRERVAEATGADQALDRAIGWELDPHIVTSACEVPTYTASVDAALALIERCGFDACRMLESAINGPDARWSGSAFGLQLALALTSALLTQHTHVEGAES